MSQRPFLLVLVKALFFGLIVCSNTLVYSQNFNLDWKPIDSVNTEIISAVKVYQTTTPNPKGSPFKAFYAEIDATDENIQFKAALATGTSITPLAFSTREEDEVYVAINGGFFGGNVSYSLVLDEGQELVPNIRALNRGGLQYYPTRGAFGILNNGQPDVAWVYTESGQTKPYAYPIPSPNDVNTTPQPVPNANFPEGGSLWDVATAIGGSPVLVENGAINVTDDEELIDVGNNTYQPRTAIGYTADKKIILLVVDGRAPSVSVGATLPELAQIMIELGAVEALNLDGGGSSAMVANDQLINKPSDGSMRKIPSAFLVMQKRKTLDTDNATGYVEVNGSWLETANTGFYGDSKARYKTAGDGSSYAAYSFKDLEPAQYEITAWWVPSSNRSKETPYIIARAGLPNDTVRVDQSVATGANKFNVIGTFHLGTNDSLFVSDLVSDGGLVTVDAIQLKKVGKSKPSISFTGDATGNFLRGQTLELDLTAASPNSSMELENLTITVSDGLGETQQISSEAINGFALSKKFTYDFASIGELLVFTFTVTDDGGNEAFQTYTANIRPFDITFSPDTDTLEVTTGDEVVLNISAELPENTTSTFASLRLFKSSEGEENAGRGSDCAFGSDYERSCELHCRRSR